jgi:hypothetical protein
MADTAPMGKDEAIDLLRDALEHYQRLAPGTVTAREALRLTAHVAPSTAPEVKTWQERLNDSGQWPVSSSWIKAAHMEAEIADLRAALASRPAEVDDEGLPGLPLEVARASKGEVAFFVKWSETGKALRGGLLLFTAEQYRQGQCDAVAADRARRGVDDWISVEHRLPEIGREVLVYRPNSERGTVTALARFIRYEGASDFYWDNSYPGKGNMHLDTSITHWKPMPAAPSHTTNKEGS